MATAKVEATVTSLTLHLSAEEARTLRVILSRIGGVPSVTPRRYADDIATALDWTLGDYRDFEENEHVTGSITFS